MPAHNEPLSGEPATYSALEYVLNKKNALSIYEISVVNALERYALELVALKVICQFFEALEESTMVRASAFLDHHLARQKSLAY